MRRIAAFLLLLALASLLTGVVLAQGEESAKTAQPDCVIATVDGVAIRERDLNPRLASFDFFGAQGELSEQSQAEKRQEARRSALEVLISEQVLLNEAQRRNIHEIHEVLADSQQRYARMIASVESYVLASYPNVDRDELDRQVDALLKVSGTSREQYRSDARRAAILSALEESLCTEAPSPSLTELQQAYNHLYAQQKKLFDENENEFEAALLSGGPVVYRPRHIKLIQKAEFTFDPQVVALIRQTKALSSEDGQAMERDQYLQLANKVEPIYEALLTGSRSFEDVLEEMNPDSLGKVNFFHPDSTRFGESYYIRADAFATVGEISTAFVIPNGYAILRYAGDLEACEQVPFEDVRELIARQLGESQREEYLALRKAELMAEADIWRAPEVP